jgi:hypothetical protein
VSYIAEADGVLEGQDSWVESMAIQHLKHIQHKRVA